jgi:hypothetical protein
MSIRATSAAALFPTQIEPGATARPYGSPPTGTEAATRFVAGSMR